LAGCRLIQEFLDNTDDKEAGGVAADDRTFLVNPERAAVRKGAQKQFAAFWYDSKTNTLEAATEVTWSIGGQGKHEGTAITANGLLMVASEESSQTLTVQARCADNEPGTAKVTVSDTDEQIPHENGIRMVPGLITLQKGVSEYPFAAYTVSNNEPAAGRSTRPLPALSRRGRR
jgi:hypothetical protein